MLTAHGEIGMMLCDNELDCPRVLLRAISRRAGRKESVSMNCTMRLSGRAIGMVVIAMLAIGIFSAFMLYDLKRIVDGGETNYISATLALYLSIFNVFQSLLALLGIFGGERD